MTWSRLLRDPLGFLWAALSTRGVRLLIYAFIVAFLFPSSRYLLIVAIILTLGVMWYKDYRKTGSRKIIFLIFAILLIKIGYFISYFDVRNVDEARIAKRPWGAGISQVKDGKYTGEGEGYRGPIKVEIEVRNHRIISIRTLEYSDLISVLDNQVSAFKRDILTKGMLERPNQPEMFRGATETLTGYVNAIESALTKGIADFPEYSLFSKVYLNIFIGQAPDRVTLNSLAILFATFMVFEYALQSMLVPGTGRSINCYNCASCVGVCPLKEVEGVQMPMGLVLLTRLGEYDRVMELSKYCVGCGRCACKCPIGNSGPLIISAAFQAARQKKLQKSADTGKETA